MLIKGNLGTPPNCDNPWGLVGRLADANRLVGMGEEDGMEEVDWTEGDVVATAAAAAALALAAFMAAMAAMLARMGLA